MIIPFIFPLPALLKNKKQEARTSFASTRRLAGQGWLWGSSSSTLGLRQDNTTDPSVPISYISGGLAPTLPLWMINPTLQLVEEDFKSSFTNFIAVGACTISPGHMADLARVALPLQSEHQPTMDMRGVGHPGPSSALCAERTAGIRAQKGMYKLRTFGGTARAIHDSAWTVIQGASD